MQFFISSSLKKKDSYSITEYNRFTEKCLSNIAPEPYRHLLVSYYMLMWISRTIEPLFCLTTYGIASNYKLKTKHHAINFCQDFDKKRPYLILSYLTAVTYMSLIVQMCMCVCFHGCFCVPFFMLPTPYCPYIILPKCPKSSTHFLFSLFYFVSSPVQTKPQMFMFSPYPNISAETLAVLLWTVVGEGNV